MFFWKSVSAHVYVFLLDLYQYVKLRDHGTCISLALVDDGKQISQTIVINLVSHKQHKIVPDTPIFSPTPGIS